VLDAIVLLAAIASGFAISKAAGTPSYVFGGDSHDSGPMLHRVVSKGPAFLIGIVAPILASSSLATLCLALIPPRPAWRRWIRQPGVLGPLAIAVVVAIDGARDAAIATTAPRHSFYLDGAIYGWARLAFAALVASWMTLWLLARWRSPLAWTDRAGVWLCIGWIACSIAATACGIIDGAIRAPIVPTPAPP
jgi:hypothetical protein